MSTLKRTKSKEQDRLLASYKDSSDLWSRSLTHRVRGPVFRTAQRAFSPCSLRIFFSSGTKLRQWLFVGVGNSGQSLLEDLSTSLVLIFVAHVVIDLEGDAEFPSSSTSLFVAAFLPSKGAFSLVKDCDMSSTNESRRLR